MRIGFAKSGTASDIMTGNVDGGTKSPPTPTVFEGASLELVISKILRQVGPDARILSASKVRRGGVAGFFTRESYVITLAPGRVNSSSKSAPSRAAKRSPTRQAGEHRTSSSNGKAGLIRANGTAATNGSNGVRAGTGTASESVSAKPGADTWDAVVQATEAVTDVLELSASGEGGQEPPGATLGHPGTEAGNGNRPASDPPTVARGNPATDGADRSFDAILHKVIKAAGAGPEPMKAAVATPGPMKAAVATPEATKAAVANPEPTGVSEPDPEIETPPHPSHVALARLGLPSHLLPTLGHHSGDTTEPVRREELASAILKAMATLPPPPKPPSMAGSILAVVGDAEAAVRLAGEIANEIGLDPNEVPVASPVPLRRRVPARRVIRGADGAAERAPGWKRRPHPTVVAIVAPMASPYRGWARHLLGSLDPTAVWAVVPATAKTGDIDAWAKDMGGVNALVVEGTEFTRTPAEILAAGIPIARLDRLKATPEQWAAILTERLEAS